jgi:6-phosphofructokinase 1
MKLAVLTSGGDAPGMNAAVRAVVRSGIHRGWVVYGVEEGFAGLMAGNYKPLGLRDVGGILQLGGTMLGSARSLEFKTVEGRKRAVSQLRQVGIEALIVIGGNGSQAGAFTLHQEGFPVVGISSTIDNDLAGFDITLGVDTALNVALEAIDRLKTTASSHHRAFLVEVMGRDCGYLALTAGIAGGAEVTVLPEFETTPEQVVDALHDAFSRGKSHALVVVAEGAMHNAQALADHCNNRHQGVGFKLRVVTLGHVQRGGAPGAFDRLLGSRLGVAAVKQIFDRNFGVIVGLKDGQVAAVPHEEAVGVAKQLPTELLEMAQVLSR